MSNLKFVGLHAHSGFSIGDGCGSPKSIVDFVHENEMDGIALTEHGVMTSASHLLDAQKECDKKGIKFKTIFGVEAYLIPSVKNWLVDKQNAKEEKEKAKEAPVAEIEDENVTVENEKDSKAKWFNPVNRRHHGILLARDKKGLENLFRLVTQSNVGDNFYRYPRIDFEMLRKYNEGIVFSSACLGGLGSWICMRDQEKGSDEIQKSLENEFMPLLEIFGPERAYLELQFNRVPEQRFVNDELIKLSKKIGYKLIATADSHCSSDKMLLDREIHRILFRQGRGYKKEDLVVPTSVEELECQLFPKNGDQMFEAYKEMYADNSENDQLVKEAIERTHSIAHDYIETVRPDGSLKLPVLYQNPSQKLEELCFDALREKNLDKNEIYVDRLNLELKVIKEKKFENYFLTLCRAMELMKTVSLTSPGRGSGAGSICCYLLGITQLDPIKHELLFERFLSSARSEAPDVDVDTEDRDSLIEILRKEFGIGNVIPVSNIVTLQLKSLIKDLSRLYDIPFEEVNEVTKLIETEARSSILEDVGNDQKLYELTHEKAKKYSPTYQTFLIDHPEVEDKIVNLFKQPKTVSRHAGGVVIASDAEGAMPAIRVSKELQTPFSEGLGARHLEQWGLIKFDFLGLSTLRIIHRTIELILKSQGNQNPSMEDVYKFYNENLHPDIIDPKDQKVFNYVYKQGNFPGIFQFSETAAQSFCKKAQPESIVEIAAITSIFRPGPLHASGDKLYIESRHGRREELVEHPIIEEILGPTHYVLTFQEQFMMLANKLAGFSLEESDNLRKLLVKPITSLGDDLKKKRIEAGEKFITGCVENGLTEQRAKKLWEQEILGFISYGFNKSHAMSYAYVSYQCAWLYTYHETEWLRAYLDDPTDREKAINDVTSVGYKVGKIDVNKSRKDWEIIDNTIYPSMLTIKGVGDIAVDELNSVRESVGGHFKSFEDFFYKDQEFGRKKEIRKVYKYTKFNKRALDALIKLESFDYFDIVGEGKLFKTYRHMYLAIIGQFAEFKLGKMSLQEVSDDIPEDDRHDWSNMEKIEFQKDLIGTYDRNLLFDKDVLDTLNKYNVRTLADLSETPQKIWFILMDYEKKKTKGGKDYFKLTIGDGGPTTKTLNFFNPMQVKKNAVYIGKLNLKDSWVNASRNDELIRLS